MSPQSEIRLSASSHAHSHDQGLMPISDMMGLRMKRDSKLAIGLAASLVALGVAVAIILPHGALLPPLVPTGSYSLSRNDTFGSAPYYWKEFTHSNTVTTVYRVTGAWSATAPTQVILGKIWGLNYAGCWFSPINYPSGAYLQGCWPTFAGFLSGTMDEAFHICVDPRYLPTGSFVIIFRSTGSADVTVTDAFVVEESPFPQSDCPLAP